MCYTLGYYYQTGQHKSLPTRLSSLVSLSLVLIELYCTLSTTTSYHHLSPPRLFPPSLLCLSSSSASASSSLFLFPLFLLLLFLLLFYSKLYNSSYPLYCFSHLQYSLTVSPSPSLSTQLPLTHSPSLSETSLLYTIHPRGPRTVHNPRSE